MATLIVDRLTRRVHLCNDEGIDLPKAAVLSEIAGCFTCEIHISCGDRHANARSVSELLRLMAEPGCEVVVETEGFEDQEALNSVESLLAHPF